jgi:arylsulfatase A-like enzyme
VDREGIVRPSWYVNAGARVAVRLRLPPGAPELRWHEAATAGARSVRVLDGARADVLSRGAGASGWEPRRASLASHAGHEVVIELAAEGEGTAFFGEPRVVASGPETSTPDVLVYLIDTLRADALGAYGSPRAGVSPTIDALARGGVVFSQALSTSSWTKPAIPTLLTGLHPMTHRVGATSYTDRLPEGVPLLQEAFRTAGWRTGSFSASPLGSTLSGLERGFAAAYTPQRWQGEIGDLEHPGAEQLHAGLLAWVDEEPELPFFAYVQTLEVHEWKRARYARDLAPGFEPYDAAVHDADRRLGELLEALRSRGRHPLVVVLADHGESFGEHGVHGHGTSLFQSQIHIPLVLYAEGALPAMTVTDPVALTDVAPTVLDLAGLPPLPGQDGASLAAFPRGEGAAPRGVSSELVRFVWRPDAPPWRSMVSPELGKLIRVKGLPDLAYDLAHDRCETRPRPALAGTLAAALDERLREEDAAHERFAAQHGATTKGAVDAAEVERLRALGYVQ